MHCCQWTITMPYPGEIKLSLPWSYSRNAEYEWPRRVGRSGHRATTSRTGTAVCVCFHCGPVQLRHVKFVYTILCYWKGRVNSCMTCGIYGMRSPPTRNTILCSHIAVDTHSCTVCTQTYLYTHYIQTHYYCLRHYIYTTTVQVCELLHWRLYILIT